MNARTLAAIIFMLCLIAAGAKLFPESARLHTNYHAPTTSTSSTPCQEDEACWNCHTMGNLVCGKGH